MRIRRNDDRRLRALQRELTEHPDNVELQHAVVMELARVGDLPDYAVERLIPGRPAQPWQFVPASYVFLEARRLGIESDWNEGRVEVEWTQDQIPEDPQFGGSTPAPRRFYVGTRRHGLWSCMALAGVPGAERRSTLRDRPLDLVDMLKYLPPRWVPGLTWQEGCDYALTQHWSASIGREARRWRLPRSIPVFFADEVAAPGLLRGLANRHDCPPSSWEEAPPDYAGPYPDAYLDQWLLQVSTRIRTDGSGRRSLTWGPPIDVRLVKRARIMQKRGKAWRN